MIPKIIDLFSGCGGLSLGFDRAGFEFAGGMELMPCAHKTISYNLAWRKGIKEAHICADITRTDEKIFNDKIGPEGCIVIGGPPCQAYSMAGKGKLKSLGEDRINTNDARGFLYQDFLRFVYAVDARAVVMENVPEAASFGTMNIPQIVCESLESHGYEAKWTVLNSADYGVPQTRERIILVAVKKEENVSFIYPTPDHTNKTDGSSTPSRRMAGFDKYANFVEPPKPKKDLPDWVTVGEALSDLPSLFPTADSKYNSLKTNVRLGYGKPAQNEYQKIMRTWFGKECKGVTGNTFRKTVRDFPIFELMKQGDNYTQACEIADRIFEEKAELYGYDKGSEPYEKMKAEMVPVYDRTQFDTKWKRLSENKPSHTLVAHLSKDTYSHINPWEPRGISVREAARIQSFPDDFFFDCNMGDAFKQIGNAVPPLMAYKIAESVRQMFE